MSNIKPLPKTNYSKKQLEQIVRDMYEHERVEKINTKKADVLYIGDKPLKLMA